jgi:hypothetical protein
MRSHDPDDRRRRHRFNLRLEVQCAVLGTGKILEGQTSDISSLAVRFQTGRQLPVGLRVKLSLRWPVRLDGMQPLQLVIYGCVIRDDNRGTVVEANTHEFRLAARWSEVAPRRRRSGSQCVSAA